MYININYIKQEIFFWCVTEAFVVLRELVYNPYSPLRATQLLVIPRCLI